MKRFLKLMAISLVSIFCMTFVGSILSGSANASTTKTGPIPNGLYLYNHYELNGEVIVYDFIMEGSLNDADLTFDFSELINWHHPSFTLSAPHDIIVVKHEDEEVVCRFVSDNASFLYIRYHKSIDSKVNVNTYWVPYEEQPIDLIYKDFVTITLIKDDSVIGYALIKIDFTKEDKESQVVILVQKLLDEPITETEAQELINKIKNDNKD